jgi:hypothetical protein
MPAFDVRDRGHGSLMRPAYDKSSAEAVASFKEVAAE